MKEEEIRPLKIFDEYLRLAEADTKTYFSRAEMVSDNCPACDSTGTPSFVKHGFTYEECQNCLTLYVNPRPVAETFSRYYTESPSAKFWATTFYKETAQARKEKLWKPKAKLVLEILGRYEATGHSLIDIGGGYGLFAEEMRDLSGRSPIVIEPGPHLADACREKSLVVIQKFLEQVTLDDLPIEKKTFISFELFEHLHSPTLFLSQLNRLMSPNDLFIFTTLSVGGVDIQALWEDSKSVMPPHHLNFLNPQSISILLDKLGFEALEITTPGKLDINILENNFLAIKDRFWRTFIATASDKQKKQWQEMIAETGQSSHMMVVCRKI